MRIHAKNASKTLRNTSKTLRQCPYLASIILRLTSYYKDKAEPLWLRLVDYLRSLKLFLRKFLLKSSELLKVAESSLLDGVVDYRSIVVVSLCSLLSRLLGLSLSLVLENAAV